MQGLPHQPQDSEMLTLLSQVGDESDPLELDCYSPSSTTLRSTQDQLDIRGGLEKLST